MQMPAISETLEAVCGLASQIPGLTVLGCEEFPASARIRISATGDQAIRAVQWAAESANTSIEPWLREADAVTKIEQAIVVNVHERDGLEFGELQMLGIHLVWHLHKLGILATHDANVLLREWGVALVGV